MRKNRLYLLKIFIISILLFGCSSNKINDWGIGLPNPIKKDVIFSDIGPGDGIRIIVYTFNDNKINEIINNSSFKPISGNSDDVNLYLDNFYDELSKWSKKGQALFDQNIANNEIINDNNYFSYSERNVSDKFKDALLMILDINSNKLYYFIIVC